MSDIDQPEIYEIQVQGRLDERWSDWFEGMTLRVDIDSEGGAITTLVGPITDQSALHGLLRRIRDMGLSLLLVERIDKSLNQ